MNKKQKSFLFYSIMGIVPTFAGTFGFLVLFQLFKILVELDWSSIEINLAKFSFIGILFFMMIGALSFRFLDLGIRTILKSLMLFKK